MNYPTKDEFYELKAFVTRLSDLVGELKITNGDLLISRNATNKSISDLNKLTNVVLNVEEKLNTLVSDKDIVEETNNLECLIKDGVFTINSPISVNCSSTIEQNISIPIGVFYFNGINIRINTVNGWKSAKLI